MAVDIDFVNGSPIQGYKAVTMEGGTRTIGSAEALDIVGSNFYKAQLGKPTGIFPAETVAGNSLVLTDTQDLHEVTFQSIDVNINAAAVTFGTPEICVTDALNTVYWQENLVQGINHFTFPDGLRVQKTPGSGASAFGDFSVQILNSPAGTHQITASWKI